MNNDNSPQTFRAVFFDWDNTLVDTWPILFRATNVVLEHFGLSEINMEELKVRARLSSRESFPKIFGDNWKEALRIFYDAIHENKNDIKLYEGTLPLLQSLKKSGYGIGIISNKKGDLLREEIGRFKIPNDLVLGSGDTSFDKPHPEMGLIALRHFNLQASEVVYVGDSITDWLFAKNLNMAAIAIGNDDYDGQLLARFDVVNESIGKLLYHQNSHAV
jgi:phosphoglycolate phosphatase